LKLHDIIYSRDYPSMQLDKWGLILFTPEIILEPFFTTIIAAKIVIKYIIIYSWEQTTLWERW